MLKSRKRWSMQEYKESNHNHKNQNETCVALCLTSLSVYGVHQCSLTNICTQRSFSVSFETSSVACCIGGLVRLKALIQGMHHRHVSATDQLWRCWKVGQRWQGWGFTPNLDSGVRPQGRRNAIRWWSWISYSADRRAGILTWCRSSS